MQKKLAVPDKEWEKFKFAVVVMSRPQYINDDDQIINIAEFRPNPNQRKYLIGISRFGLMFFFMLQLLVRSRG